MIIKAVIILDVDKVAVVEVKLYQKILFTLNHLSESEFYLMNFDPLKSAFDLLLNAAIRSSFDYI